MPTNNFFSRNMTLVIGVVLVLILLWALSNIGGVALNRWFG
jgi:hypothetical protein